MILGVCTTCEIWNLSDRSLHKLNVQAWIVFDIYVEYSRETVLSHSSFLRIIAVVVFVGLTHNTVLEAYVMRSDNIILRTLSHFIHVRNRSVAFGFVYNVDVLSMSHTGVKNTMWSSLITIIEILKQVF